MAPDRTILHLFKKKIPEPLPLSRIMACTLLSLSYAPGAYDVSVLQNFKIFTHLLPNYWYKDPRLTEVTYHCINFNDKVRKVPKIKIWKKR
jgi:hypothetical protein